MAEARGRADWAQTSEILAALGNGLLRGPKAPPFKARELNPYCRPLIQKPEEVDSKAAFAAMKKLFKPRRKPGAQKPHKRYGKNGRERK